jgi:hypothetical protein
MSCAGRETLRRVPYSGLGPTTYYLGNVQGVTRVAQGIPGTPRHPRILTFVSTASPVRRLGNANALTESDVEPLACFYEQSE